MPVFLPLGAAKPPTVKAGLASACAFWQPGRYTPVLLERKMLKKGKEKSAHDKKRVTRAPTGMP